MLDAITYIHWIILGVILLAGELTGATMGYLLWLGISAVVVGIVKFIIPGLSWQLQLVSFAVFALFTSWLWWRYQRKVYKEDRKTNLLNRRMDQMVGSTTRLLEDIHHPGSCRIKLGDTYWSARSAKALPAGTEVEVTKVNGQILTIEPIEPKEPESEL